MKISGLVLYEIAVHLILTAAGNNWSAASLGLKHLSALTFS
jgi:hypothetical protein